MHTTQHIAKHMKEVHDGGNWTWVNLHDTLKDITWQQATTQVYGLNTIAVLTYHVGYYATAILSVLQGKPLVAKDEESFTHPPINNAEDWNAMRTKLQADWQVLAATIALLPDDKLNEVFTAEKYGTYYRNLHGMIEHTHYHLGQITLLKKIIVQLEE
ncbi:DUF1572 domain-containing protein [Chitinophagaceae bacterium IBVUCB1]|nr:DUF1572 domain-containing protein [Chitinophagaceae bacterium IBVUCB1]